MREPATVPFRPRRAVLAVAALWLLRGAALFAQAGAAPARPEPVMSRGADGNVVIRATRVTTPIKLDGKLDEEVYRTVAPITEFVQEEPNVGQPNTEKTEAWVLFDDENIYVACRCWDSHPQGIVANDMRRDSSNLRLQDNFGSAIDTFHDGRNGFLLYTTPVGAMRDGAFSDNRLNSDWNPVWDAKVSRFEQGWIAEMAIPFKSLRYGPGRQQTWGFQMRRAMRSVNEVVHLTRVNPQWGDNAIYHMEAEATLVGLEVPPPARNLEIKPYAIARLTTDLLQHPAVKNDVAPDGGIDVKYGVTAGLAADFTYNTDFAQVEADEAQVNLTRFSLSFPEKREFFLEGQGIFQFGTGGGAGGVGASVDDSPTIFYSRRVGLNGARIVPVAAGGRLTGKAGAWSVGALSITTKQDDASVTPQTNFSVLRLQRDVLRRSTVGGIFERRSVSTLASGDNTLWGLDTNLAFFQNVNLGGYVAQTKTTGRPGDDLSYRGQFSYGADRYGVAFDRLVVGKNFNPEIGLLRRQNFRRNFALARFSPRPAHNRLVRRFTYQANFNYTTNNDNRLETRMLEGDYNIDFHNGDAFAAQYVRHYEFLPTVFQIARNVGIPIGGYGFDNAKLTWTAGQRHRVSGASSIEAGSFYDGHKTGVAFKGRVNVTSQLGVEPNISFNWVNLPWGTFTDTILGGRGTFSLSPRSFVAALVQYSSASTSLSTNLRFRWEYNPGSELFVVYTEGRSTLPEQGIPLENRGVVVKVNRLFRF